MDKEKRKQLFQQAKAWVLAAGEMIRKQINEPLEINIKSNPNDLVTSMDKAIEKFFVTNIKEYYPDHAILGEEGYGDELTSLSGTVWIIDPIDGTTNFVHQKRNFAISIGIYEEGIGEIGLIYDVMKDDLYSAKSGEGAYKNEQRLSHQPVHIKEAILGLNHHWLCENRLVDEKVMQKLIKTIRGARSYGSAALELAFVAEGVTDGYLSMRLSPWDIAAGIILIQEVGGVISNLEGEPLNLLIKQPIVVSNSHIYQDIMEEFIKKGKK